MLLIVTVRLFAKSQSDSTHHPVRPRLFASSWLKMPAVAQKQWTMKPIVICMSWACPAFAPNPVLT
jgi:hypothetical protein